MKPSIACSCSRKPAASLKYASAWPSRGTTSKMTAIMQTPSCSQRQRGLVERALDQLDERALFAQDEALALCEGEILAPFGVGLDAPAIRLVLRQRIEAQQAPRLVVGAFVRNEVADQVSAAARNDATPALGVRREGLALERVDLVADEAGDRHVGSR